MKTLVTGCKFFGKGVAALIIGTALILAVVLAFGVPYNVLFFSN